jgi:hypothetical protein
MGNFGAKYLFFGKKRAKMGQFYLPKGNEVNFLYCSFYASYIAHGYLFHTPWGLGRWHKCVFFWRKTGFQAAILPDFSACAEGGSYLDCALTQRNLL